MAEVPVTVLMPVHNAERYLGRAVDSVLAQTWRDFELLVVNDGSTDGSRALLAGIADRRLRVVDTENRGVAAALRLGVELARGRYIARMDADDESLPHRLAAQKACLDRHAEVVVAHGLAQAVDADGRPIRGVIGNPRSDLVTKWLLLWQNVPIHPTVMVRGDALRAHGLNYRPEANRAEDFDLWNRLALVGELRVLPEVLLRYRVHAGSVTRRNAAAGQAVPFQRVIRENLGRYGVAIPEAGAAELAVISGGTLVNPIDHRYAWLHGRLHALLDLVSERFCRRAGVGPGALAAIQAEQLVRWARYMLDTSRGYAATLLGQGLRRRPGAAGAPVFWGVTAGLVLPRVLRARLDRGAPRRAEWR